MTNTLKSDLNGVISALLEAGLGLKSTHVAAVEKAIAELDRLEAEVKKPRLPEGVKLSKLQDEVIKIETPGQTPDYAAPGHQAYDFVASFLTTPDVVPSTEPVHAAGDEALLPCPFCGGEALPHRVPGLGQLWRVTCKNCDAAPHGKFSREGAQAAWNRRAPAEVPDQGQRSQTPMNTETAEICPDCNGSGDAPDGAPWTCLSCGGSGGIETAEKPKPVSLKEAFARGNHMCCDFDDWANHYPEMFITRRELAILVSTLDQARGV